MPTTVDRMIVWINGTFGVGKTHNRPGHPEVYRLAAVRSRTRRLSPWPGICGISTSTTSRIFRPGGTLVPAVVDEIYRYTNPTVMIAVQTVLVESYWAELNKGLTDRGLSVLHVVLDCDQAELRHRIENDEIESQAVEWRIDHLAKFQAARPWLTESADLVLDTTCITAESAAEAIVGAATRVQSAPT